MRDESMKAPNKDHLYAIFTRELEEYWETMGDPMDTPCPWCGKVMNLYDDAAYESTEYECEHCGAEMSLSAEYSVTITAIVKEKPDEDEAASKDISKVRESNGSTEDH
jgi:hypothetical protein